jgi:hypothetical protein
MEVADEIDAFDNVMLRVHLAGGKQPIRSVYAKVRKVTSSRDARVCRIPFTSIPEEERTRFARRGEGPGASGRA